MVNKIKNRIYPQFFHNRKRGSCSSNRFFSRNKIIGIVSILVFLVVWIGIYPPTKKAEAAGIDDIATTLAAEGAAAESTITVVFQPQENIANNDRITVYIGEDSGADPWDDTDGTIDFNDVTCEQVGTTFDGYFQNDATGSAGVSFGCDADSVGDQTDITVTLGSGGGDDMYNPAAADIYQVTVVTTDDSGTGLVYVGDANDVTVSAVVLPNLSMLLDTPTGGCSGTPVVTCALGTVLTSTTVSGTYDINMGTNASGGATITINDDMTDPNGMGTIQDVANGATIDAGTDEYGISLAQDGDWTFQGNYVNNFTPIADAATPLATTVGPILEGGDDITVTHEAAISSITAAGTHTHVVTYTGSADF